jgi:hypothetical protein
MNSGAHFIGWAVYYALLFAPVPVAVAAWRFGQAAERYGSALHCLVALSAAGYETLAHGSVSPAAEVTIDSLTALVFLLLALRYNSLWLGVALLLKGIQLALHATHLTDMADVWAGGFNLYLAGLNLISLLLLATFVVATISSARRRQKRAAPDEPQLAASAPVS